MRRSAAAVDKNAPAWLREADDILIRRRLARMSAAAVPSPGAEQLGVLGAAMAPRISLPTLPNPLTKAAGSNPYISQHRWLERELVRSDDEQHAPAFASTAPPPAPTRLSVASPRRAAPELAPAASARPAVAAVAERAAAADDGLRTPSDVSSDDETIVAPGASPERAAALADFDLDDGSSVDANESDDAPTPHADETGATRPGRGGAAERSDALASERGRVGAELVEVLTSPRGRPSLAQHHGRMLAAARALERAARVSVSSPCPTE